MCQFPRIAITNYYRVAKTIEMYFLTVLETRSPKSDVVGDGAVYAPSYTLVKNPSFSPFSFKWLPAILSVPWLTAASFQSLPLSHGLLPHEPVYSPLLMISVILDLVLTLNPE